MSASRFLPVGELLAGTTILRMRGEAETLSAPVYPWQLADGRFFFKLRSARFRVSAAQAIRRDAKWIVLEEGDEEEGTLGDGVVELIVDDVNQAFARACSRMFGDVHRQLSLIGVTGAKGKTTVCHLIEGALRASGVTTGVASSLVYRLPESERPAPAASAALVLHNFLAELHRQGGTHAVIEISEEDVAEERVFGLQFAALVFTNSGGGDPGAIRRLFTEAGPDTLCAVNTDDDVGRELAQVAAGRVVTFGFRDADVTPESYASDAAGIALQLGGRELRSPLIGRHNASNLLAAATVVGEAAPQLGTVAPLPGRLERLPSSIGVDVFVDAAHGALTVESVELALAAARESAGARRLVALVACCASTAKATRPLLAKAAIAGADMVILTTGDGGHEHPASVVMDMLRGAPPVAADRLKTVINRTAAIDVAIRAALPDGIAILIGEGLSDRQLAIDALREI